MIEWMDGLLHWLPELELALNVTKLFTTRSRLLTTLKQRTFENIVGKGENAGNRHFLLFPQCFQPSPNQI